MTHYLFSYGTLQLESVQLETYGRILVGAPDVLESYRIEYVRIHDKDVLEKSQQELHPIAIKSDDDSDYVVGVIFEITESELYETDLYEVSDYKRIMENFKSGRKAWVYILKD